MVISQNEFRSSLSGEVQVIDDCIQRAAREYPARYAEQLYVHSPLARSVLIRDHIVWNIKQAFPGNYGTIRKGLFILNLDNGNVRVRFKKLNSRLLASNHPTQLSLRYVWQQLYFEGMAPTTNLTAGYRWGKGLELEVWITCPAGPFSNAWAWLVSATALSSSASTDTTNLPRPHVTARVEERFPEHVPTTEQGAQ